MGDLSIFWYLLQFLSSKTQRLYNISLSLAWLELPQDILYYLRLLWKCCFSDFFLSPLSFICRRAIKIEYHIIQADLQLLNARTRGVSQHSWFRNRFVIRQRKSSTLPLASQVTQLEVDTTYPTQSIWSLWLSGRAMVSQHHRGLFGMILPCHFSFT